MGQNKRMEGSRYEKLAARYLEQKGMDILELNYRCRTGEIDIIARDGEYLVFVEVKYRSGASFGDPSEAVTAKKQERIRKTARYYLCARQLSDDTPCRFDVAAVLGSQIRLIKHAFY